MISATIDLFAVESTAQKDAARSLPHEYLLWVADIAQTDYGLTFDVDAMVHSDIEDRSKFFPPTGRFYLVRYRGNDVGVGCIKRLAPNVGEVQRMYVQPHVRGVGAGRALVERLVQDARALGYTTLRLESLKALAAAHGLYRSVGFKDIDPYSENSMKAYQAPETLSAYRERAMFMRLSFAEAHCP
jgi:GNAT superfamily N-acetyltransferase